MGSVFSSCWQFTQGGEFHWDKERGESRTSHKNSHPASFFTGVKTQIQLVQSGAEVKKPGESVKGSCKGSGCTLTSYAISWVQQILRKGLFDIGWISTDTGAPTCRENFQGKVTLTLDKSLSTALLQAGSLKAEGTAVYTCARYTHTEKLHSGSFKKGNWMKCTASGMAGSRGFCLQGNQF